MIHLNCFYKYGFWDNELKHSISKLLERERSSKADSIFQRPEVTAYEKSLHCEISMTIPFIFFRKTQTNCGTMALSIHSIIPFNDTTIFI